LNEQAYRSAEERLWHAAGSAPTERRVRMARDGTEVRVLECGEGPATLFLHGGPNAGSTWAFLAARLPELRCIVVDRPGTGLSDPYPIRHHSELRPHSERFVPDLLDGLGIQRAHLLGSSHGGYMAMVAGLKHPDRIGRTVQMGCPGFVEGMVVSAFDRMALWPGMAWLFSRLPSSQKEIRRTFRQLGHGTSLDAERIPAVFFDWCMALMKHTPTMREELATVARLGSIRGFDPSLTIGDVELATLRSPTLFYWGDRDSYGGPDVARRLTGVIPDARLDLVPEAGHLPWLDDPDHAAAAVAGHLRVAQTAAHPSAPRPR
jgi:2-hydroxy-6-oxonona-2,4-dienedioate hydrolase